MEPFRSYFGANLGVKLNVTYILYILGQKWSNIWRNFTKIHFHTNNTMIKAPCNFQDDWAKIGVKMEIILFAPIFAPDCYFMI